jgi:hypothetical protein
MMDILVIFSCLYVIMVYIPTSIPRGAMVGYLVSKVIDSDLEGRDASSSTARYSLCHQAQTGMGAY